MQLYQNLKRATSLLRLTSHCVQTEALSYDFGRVLYNQTRVDVHWFKCLHLPYFIYT